MKIRIISVGKLKERYLVDAIQEYTKRLSRYCTLEQVEIQDEKAPENLSQREIDIVKDREAERILSQIKDEYLVVLAIDGKQLSSEELAAELVNITTYKSSNICFVIGGSLGLSDSILAKADFKLSFSRMTFPHQLMRLILLEQVYRAFRINNNEPYHK